MNILELALTRFRNYEQAHLAPCPGVNLIFGQNAQGKTNLLEAVFLCCLGRSHRTPREREMIRHGCDHAAVELSCQRMGVVRRIRYNLLAEGRHRILLDGEPVQRVGELMGRLNCVLFAPEHLSIVKDGPAERRRFLDMELSQTYPSYFFHLQQYNRVLRQRNNLLRSLREDAGLLDTLPVWDEQLAKLGAYLTQERAAFVRKLQALARENHKDISGGAELLDLEYRPSLDAPDEERALAALERRRAEDLRLCTTTLGPHRDELGLLLQGKELRAYGSQGQQRTAALALKLSQLQLLKEETGSWPVLMLDDVMSELDENRQRYLMERTLPVQTFVTATAADPGWPRGKVFFVENGSVREV